MALPNAEAPARRSAAPLIVAGPGRSGSTLLYELLALHPELAWTSNLTARLVRLPQLAALSRVNDVRWLGERAHRWRYWPRPVERYEVWDRYAPGLRHSEQPARPVGAEGIRAVRGWAASHVRWQGKNRMLIKYTGYPRFDFMRSVFPDASYVWIDRDPRAVVYSLSRMKWPSADIARDHVDRLDPTGRLEYLAARYLRHFRAKQRYSPELYHRVRYERLIEDPLATLRDVCDYAGIEWTRPFEDAVRRRPISRSANEAYRSRLTADQLSVLEQRLSEPLEVLGYR